MFIDSYHGGAQLQHGGRTSGYTTQYVHFPANGMTIMVMTNYYFGFPHWIAEAVREIIHPETSDE